MLCTVKYVCSAVLFRKILGKVRTKHVVMTKKNLVLGHVLCIRKYVPSCSVVEFFCEERSYCITDTVFVGFIWIFY